MATPDVLQRTSSVTEDFCVCGLCQEYFKRPKVLKCMHTFCSGCLNDYISKGVSRRNFHCPSCDMEIELPVAAHEGDLADLLPDDQFIATLVELKGAMKDDKCCDICIRGETSVTATNWCMDCNDAMCDACLQVHLHVKVTSTHAVSALQDMRKSPLEVMMRKKNKVSCDKHGEAITLFCIDCKDTVCVQCMAVSHRKCENVITVADAMKSRTDVDEIMYRLDSLQVPLDNVDGLERDEKMLEDNIENARHEIRFLCDSLCDKIRNQEKVAMQKLEGSAAEAKRLLKQRTEPRKLQAKTAKSSGQRMKNLIRYGSDVEVLMAFNQVSKQLNDFDQSVGEYNPDKMQIKVEFLPDEATLRYLDEFTSLGDVRIDTGADDGISSWGVTCTTQDDIIVTDCKNRRIQKFNKSGELVDHIQLDDEPRDITTCGVSDDVAIPLIGRLIIFIATRKSLTLIKKAKTERQYDAISFSTAESYLVVSCVREKRVDVIQLDGQVLRSFQLDHNGEYLFKEPRYLSSSIEGTIVVSDIGNNTVKCIDHNGHSLFTYTASSSSDLKRPQGVCADKIGNIFVADNANDRIQLLTSNGAFQRYVLGKDSGLERPCAIMVSNSNKLVIVQNDGMVKVYSYS